jgi:hypothetical protein
VLRLLKRVIWIAVLPTTHLILCACAAVSGDVWQWILLSLVDFPLLYLQKYVGDRCGILLLTPLRLTVFGTVWWLCVGIALKYIFEWLKRRRK